MSKLPPNYDERAYAGWLGKCIGVRFGAPLEGWTYEEIRDNVGPLSGYLKEDQGKIFKPDDDTALPMILIRALEDGPCTPDVSTQAIGNTWLNYLSDQQGTLWWGGYGISTEHTAYLNLANDIAAPASGSIEMNGAALAEQIGGQIFSDIWGLVAPANPAQAALLAARAASVSHDGNGIYGGRFVAALVSEAFVESDPGRLIAAGLAQIPTDSEYARVITAMQEFHQQHPDDWHAAYAYLKENFGYDRYPGMVHIIPNAGVIALALLYGGGCFSRSIQIANMAGWDTDCNVGNVGAIMGVAVGLDGIDTFWREPMNDLLITASLIGTRNILTIPQCADLFCRLGRQMVGEPIEEQPRYHFNYAGSTNNFLATGERGRVIELRHAVLPDGTGALQASIRKLNKKGEARIFTRTYYRPGELSGNYYGATFSPLVYPGQTITAKIYLPSNAPASIKAGIFVRDDNSGETHQAVAVPLVPGEWQTLIFDVPSLENACLSAAGIVVRNLSPEVWSTGSIYIAALDWSGPASFSTDFAHERHESGGISQWTRLRGYWRLEDGGYSGSGPGVCETYTGDIAWNDYTLKVALSPIAGGHHNINVRVQGALRSYAFGLAPDNKVVFYRKDGDYQSVASADFAWRLGETYELSLTANGESLAASVTGEAGSASLTWVDQTGAYLSGQVGLSCWHGSHTVFREVSVSPVQEG